jgi:hypothetical protein
MGEVMINIELGTVLRIVGLLIEVVLMLRQGNTTQSGSLA